MFTLDRKTLLGAITLGLRKADGKPLAQQASTILEMIDTVTDMQAIANGEAPAPQPIPERASAFEAPPPPPEGIVPVTELDEPLPVQASPKLVVLASEREADQEIERTGPLRLKSLFVGGNKPRVLMQNVLDWANEKFPEVISVIPRDRTERMQLQREIRAIPCMGGREKDHSVKVCYRHPDFDKDMEVGIPFIVGDCQEAFPDVQVKLQEIAGQAREMYRVRPKYIDGKQPTGPSLDQSFRMMKEPPKPGRQLEIHLADADHSVRPEVESVRIDGKLGDVVAL